MVRRSRKAGVSEMASPSALSVLETNPERDPKIRAGILIAQCVGILSKPFAEFPLANLRQYKTDNVLHVIAGLNHALKILNGL